MDAVSDKHRLLLENLPDAFAYHRIITGSSGKPVEYVFLDVNPAFEKRQAFPGDRLKAKR